MPSLNKPKKKTIKRGRSKEAWDLYNTSKWRKLREAHFMLHPLCERCLKEGKTSPTEEIHHIKPILTGGDELEMEKLAYDPDNLIGLCKECHHEVHNEMRRNGSKD